MPATDAGQPNGGDVHLHHVAQAQSMKRFDLTPLWFAVALIAAILSVGLYFFWFGLGSKGLSNNTEDWARFGEYTGGVLGIFAFVGVLVTINLQRRQLDRVSKQLKRAMNQGTVDELMQLCRVVAANIDEVLDRPLILSASLGELLNWAHCAGNMRGVAQLVMSDNPSVRTNVDREFKKGVPPQVQELIAWLGPELDQLATCVQDLVIWGGSEVIMNYYRQRYSSIASTVLRLGTTCKTEVFWSAPKVFAEPL
jgi:hypothetical protein